MGDVVRSLSVILASYNEKDNLPYIVYLLIDVLRSLDLKYEILLVDDSSPDGTADVYAELQALFPSVNLKLLRRPGKLGLGSAYMDGLAHTSHDFILIMDADLSHHPKYIREMIKLQRTGNYDIVSGTRYAPGGGACGWSSTRVFVSKTANFLAHFLLRPALSDLTGSYRLYRRSLFEAVLKQVTSRGYIFQMEIAVRAEKQFNARVAEVPIIFIERLYGVSKLGKRRSAALTAAAGVQEVFGYLYGLVRLYFSI
ncbi:dolichol-phosphate-mannose synthase family protein [Babesia caballi]|uniref:Dolichol-phosphate mannosyltransferase subunit 1 n=1 Tax=Babesia caballi TaxID=5871 RepID=A0AAV4LT20_BABCB|nr:dolichol-phosphate-mannose synthase family protein [Babesia caballi]